MTKRNLLFSPPSYMDLVVFANHFTLLILMMFEILPSNDRSNLQDYCLWMSAISSTTCFYLIVLTTIFLVITFRRNQRWRKEKTSQSEKKNSDKDIRLVRTILSINTIFTVCYFPYVWMYFVQIIRPPRFSIMDHYFGGLVNILLVVSGTLQSTSSAISIVFYYRLTSNFKSVSLRRFNLKNRGAIKK